MPSGRSIRSARTAGSSSVCGSHPNTPTLAGWRTEVCCSRFATSPSATPPPTLRTPLRLTTAHISADFAGSACVGDWVESHADVQRVGGQLAFVNVYLVVNKTRIVRASGVYLRREAHPAQGG